MVPSSSQSGGRTQGRGRKGRGVTSLVVSQPGTVGPPLGVRERHVRSQRRKLQDTCPLPRYWRPFPTRSQASTFLFRYEGPVRKHWNSSSDRVVRSQMSEDSTPTTVVWVQRPIGTSGLFRYVCFRGRVFPSLATLRPGSEGVTPRPGYESEILRYCPVPLGVHYESGGSRSLLTL